MQKAIVIVNRGRDDERRDDCWLHSVHPKPGGSSWDHQAVIALGDPDFPYLELRVVPMRDVLLVRRAWMPIVEEA